MTISSSLNAGVAGLAANASRLGTISDNIANSATYGYKRVETEFHSMVMASGSASYAAGGVRTSSMRMIDERAPLVPTSNSTDLAVRGRGMIPVTKVSALASAGGDFPLRLATTGSFRTNDEGYLTTASGLALLGWPAAADGTIPSYPRDTQDGLAPVRINRNEFNSEPTTLIGVTANLPATATDAGASGETQLVSIEYYDNLGKSESLAIEYIPTVPATGSSNEWTMRIRDSASGGAVVGEYTLTFDASPANGGLMASVTPVTGGPYDGAAGTVSFNVNGGPMQLNIGRLTEPGGMSQISDKFAPGNITKNGFPVGNLSSIEVDANGYVRVFFDNGIGRTISQIPLADVPNVNGLRTHDSQTYSPSSESGQMFLWSAGDGPTGEVIAFARQESATDVAGELTDLIQTQRAYSSNAKVIQTVDEMLQETTNIKR